jgi:nicotinamide-nucleotide amidase
VKVARIIGPQSRSHAIQSGWALQRRTKGNEGTGFMIAEIISIGDEITSGQRLDTNSQALSRRLGDLGIQVAFHSTVGDTLQDNIDVFRIAATRADIVVSTGGLGPTADDLTREAMASAFGLALEFRQEAWEHIASLFAQRKRPMPERNRVQAMFPMTSRIIDNPHGTAPGIDLSVEIPRTSGVLHACRLFALPGVPAEMEEMLVDTVEPRLIAEMGAGSKRWRYHCVKMFGIGESDVERELPELIAREREPRVGITVSKATITLRIAARTESQNEFDKLIEPTQAEIRRAFRPFVFGEGDMDLQDAVNQLMIDQRLRLGVIEVGAGSWIAPMLSCEQPSGEYGLTQSRWLNSFPKQGSRPVLSQDEIVAELVELASSLLRDSDLDAALAVGIYPSIEQVMDGRSLPTTDFSMAFVRRSGPCATSTVSLGGHPEVFYARLAKTALNFVRLEVLNG